MPGLGSRALNVGIVLSLGVGFGVFVAFTHEVAFLAVAAASTLLALALFPLRWVVPAALAALSLCYIPTLWRSAYVGDIPLGTRVARDFLLAALGLTLLGRSRVGSQRGLGVVIFPPLVVGVFLLAAGPAFYQVRIFRYFVALPLVALVVADALRNEVGEDRAVSIVSRTIVLVACASALVGIGQALGLGPASYYSGYVDHGLPRSTGILGQPNNQGFLLVLGLLVLRHSGQFSRSIPWATILLVSGTLLTFSRAAVGGILVVMLLPLLERRRHLPRPRTDRPVSFFIAVGLCAAAPALFALRSGTENLVQSVLKDSRQEQLERTFGDLGYPGLLVGRVETFRPYEDGISADRYSGFILDNLYAEVLVIGGGAALIAWGILFAGLWRRASLSRHRATAHGCLLLTAVYGLATSVLGLFPGIFLVWLLVLIVAFAPGHAHQEVQEQRV